MGCLGDSRWIRGAALLSNLNFPGRQFFPLSCRRVWSCTCFFPDDVLSCFVAVGVLVTAENAFKAWSGPQRWQRHVGAGGFLVLTVRRRSPPGETMAEFFAVFFDDVCCQFQLMFTALVLLVSSSRSLPCDRASLSLSLCLFLSLSFLGGRLS